MIAWKCIADIGQVRHEWETGRQVKETTGRGLKGFRLQLREGFRCRWGTGPPSRFAWWRGKDPLRHFYPCMRAEPMFTGG